MNTEILAKGSASTAPATPGTKSAGLSPDHAANDAKLAALGCRGQNAILDVSVANCRPSRDSEPLRWFENGAPLG